MSIFWVEAIWARARRAIVQVARITIGEIQKIMTATGESRLI